MKTFLLLLFPSLSWAVMDCSPLFTDSIGYYNLNSRFYADTRAHVSPGFVMQRDRFINLLPHQGKILEIGAGHGRDAAHFLNLGFRVTVTEPSVGLARIAVETTQAGVLLLPAENLNYVQQFDGIWASASLIHVPHEGLRDILLKLKRALKVGGTLHASFLRGVGTDDSPERIADGRYFNRVSESYLRKLIATIEGFEINEDFTGTQINDYFGKLAPSKELGFFNLYVKRTR